MDELRVAVGIATAHQLAGLTEGERRTFRRKTAAWLDECFFRIVAQCAPDGLMECGAHEAGASSRFSRDQRKNAVAIEANPVTFQEKTVQAQRDGVTVLNCGVSSQAGVIDFHVPKGDATAGYASTLRKPGGEYDSVQVPARTVDDLHDEHFGTSVVALWIDVEGAALDVLKGATRMLGAGRCAVMKIEVETRHFWQGQALASDVDRFLQERGMTPVLRDIEYAEQHNLVYVQESLVAKLDEVLLTCWQELALLRLAPDERVRRSRKQVVVDGIKAVLGSEGTIAAHRVAAFLGSKESREHLVRVGRR